MRIYVDFDDCLCETARTFSTLVDGMFGIRVPYEEMRYFNLQDAFGLTDGQYRQLLDRGHEPEVLLSYAETPGARDVINEWIGQGHEVCVITGRPFSTYEPSRAWLDSHGMGDAKLFCLDKYYRETCVKDSAYCLEPEDFYRMRFDFAVEDSPSAFRFFDPMPGVKVLVFDRPWNRMPALPGGNYLRVLDWADIREKTSGKETAD